LLAHPDMLKVGGEKRELSVLFSDISGFTTISETMEVSDLAALLHEYLTEMTEIILEEGGIIDKFEGDSIMAEFGAPLPLPDHADRAVRSGIRMQVRLKELREDWRKRELPALHCRVGVNTGSMIVGNMGTDRIFDYTVLGDAVNLAARLEGANKFYDTGLMISEATHSQLTPDAFRTRVLDIIKVKGKDQAVRVYEVIGEASEDISPECEAYFNAYREGFKSYLTRDFDRASTQFSLALSHRPGDGAARLLAARVEDIDETQLPEDWDGAYVLSSK